MLLYASLLGITLLAALGTLFFPRQRWAMLVLALVAFVASLFCL